MSQNYQKFPKFCNLSVKIAPDIWRKNRFSSSCEKFPKLGVISRLNFNFSEKLGSWVTAHNFEKKNMGSLGELVKIYGSLGEGDAKNGGLKSLTYASPPEWECSPPAYTYSNWGIIQSYRSKCQSICDPTVVIRLLQPHPTRQKWGCKFAWPSIKMHTWCYRNPVEWLYTFTFSHSSCRQITTRTRPWSTNFEVGWRLREISWNLAYVFIHFDIEIVLIY